MRKKRPISFTATLWILLNFCFTISMFAMAALCIFPSMTTLDALNSRFGTTIPADFKLIFQLSFIASPFFLIVGAYSIIDGLNCIRDEFIESYFGIQKSTGHAYKIAIWYKKKVKKTPLNLAFLNAYAPCIIINFNLFVTYML